jgi:hypothetical protein
MDLYISYNILKNCGDWAQIVAWRCPVDMDGVWEIVRVDDWTRHPDPDCIAVGCDRDRSHRDSSIINSQHCPLS